MSFIHISNDEKITHIYIAHKHAITIIVSILLLLTIPLGIYGYLYYRANIYDSSSNKSELQDFNPPAPPKDIKIKIQHLEKQMSSQPQAKIPIVEKIQSATIPAFPKFASISAAIRIPILMYHYVEYVQDRNDKTRIALNTTPYTLEAELKSLLYGGYTCMTMSEVADVLDGKLALPPNPVALTFDDGYRDFYTDAYPILKKYHVKATQYAIAGFLDRPNHLLSTQLKEIASDGLVEIGAHTVHHLWLKGQSLRTDSDEIFQSRILLEQIINKPVVSFAYPFGAFDDQAIQMVKDSGFRTATSTLPGVLANQMNRFFLFRLRPGGRLGENFLQWLHQETVNPL